MAETLVTNFKNIAYKFVGAGDPNLDEDVLGPVPVNHTWMIIGLDLCNVQNTGVDVDVVLVKSGVSYYLCKSVPVPAGATLPVIISQKHILEEGMTLRINCNTDAGVQVTGAYMDTYIESV